jgi:hypothetical protein
MHSVTRESFERREKVMRSLSISKSSWFTRFFFWAWGIKPKDLDICRLIWGTALSPFCLVSFRKVYRFIPRIAVFYLLVTAAEFAMRSYRWGVAMLALALIFTIQGYFIPARTEAEAEATLSEATGRASRIFGWIGECLIVPPLFWIADRVEDIRYSSTGAYLRALKERTCIVVHITD